MEFLLLLLVPLAIGTLFSGGDDDETPPERSEDPIIGTESDDVLRGAVGNNPIDGDDGDDLIFGYRGDDTLEGGEGSDFLDGGLDNDVLSGGAGNDVLVGAAGNDQAEGGLGRDFILGGAGNDTLAGDGDDDTLIGSTGADMLYGGAGNDVLDGTAPQTDGDITEEREEFRSAFDSRYGEDATNADLRRFMDDFASADGVDAPDALFGGLGNDQLGGDNGDTLTGGSDADNFAVNWVPGYAPVTVTDFDAAADEGFRVFVDDSTLGTPEFGVRDDDLGNTEILVDQNVVAVLTGVSADTLDLSNIGMQVDGAEGVTTAIRLDDAGSSTTGDVFRGSTDPELVDGSDNDDLIFGNGGADTLRGGDGADFLDGGNANDVLIGGDGDDLLAGAEGDDSLNGGTGDDLVSGGAGDDTLVGGNGDDLLVGSTGADQLFGGNGDDVLDGVLPTATDSLADAFADLRPELASAFGSRYGDDATSDDLNRLMRDIASESGDDAPDLLDGGTGEDILAGNDGDTLTGGSDEDIFLIDWAAGNSAVSITDLNALGETVYVQIEQTTATAPEFGIRDAADGSAVEVVLDGSVVAVLDDLTVATISASQIVLQVDQAGTITNYSAAILPSIAA